MRVVIDIRESGTRRYKPASPRAMYPVDVTFCLRYTFGGKRGWEQLSVSKYKEAQAAALNPKLSPGVVPLPLGVNSGLPVIRESARRLRPRPTIRCL